MSRVDPPQVRTGRFTSRTLDRYREPSPGRGRVLGLMTVLGLAMLLVLLLDRVAPGPGDVPPSQEPSITGAPSSVGRFDPPPLARLQDAPTRLAWPSQPAAERLRVRVFDETMSVMWESDWLTNDLREIDVPTEVVERFAEGGRFGWRVFIDEGSGEVGLTFGEFEVVAEGPAAP